MLEAYLFQFLLTNTFCLSTKQVTKHSEKQIIKNHIIFGNKQNKAVLISQNRILELLRY